MWNQDFPAEITNLCDNELKAVGCLYPYTRQADGRYIYTSTQTTESGTKSVSLQVTQPDILDNINRLTGKLEGKKPDSIRYCTIGQGNLIAEFDLLQGDKKTANYALLLAQGGVDILASIPNDGLTNFSCNEPILLTTTNLLYVQCSGENGQANFKSIYTIDLDKGISTKTFQCTSTGVSNLGENNVTCQNFLPSAFPQSSQALP